jgi:ATP-dependent Clp protease ATP-binding subunit ClpC
MLSSQIIEGETAVVDVDENGEVKVLPGESPARLLQPVG